MFGGGLVNYFKNKDIFVFDLANNHQGDVEHAKKIIKMVGLVCSRFDIKGALKFQYRDLPHFVHKSFRNKSDNKHIQRFLSTSLSYDQFSYLKNFSQDQGLLTMCTPFDEVSVDKILEHKFDIIKVASCSATDWPLLEKIANGNLPTVCSTGGLDINGIDNTVSFFKHKAVDFALMHCVGIYPTPNNLLNLQNISDFKDRYPEISIGWSTHEDPNETVCIAIAKACGASLFERHVGQVDLKKGYKLNAYSSDQDQLSSWIESYRKTCDMMGEKHRQTPCNDELASLQDLRRGVYVDDNEVNIKNNSDKTKLKLHFPCQEGQVSASQLNQIDKINKPLKPGFALMKTHVVFKVKADLHILKKAIHQVKALLNYAKISLHPDFETEYSHHYGVNKFFTTGTTLITVINREYGKKIVVQLPNQKHPAHFHKLKTETFICLYGELIGFVDNKKYILQPGDQVTVPAGVWHSFESIKGCVFEEISTSQHPNDSVYKDPNINKMDTKERKTKVDHWGRFQLK